MKAVLGFALAGVIGACAPNTAHVQLRSAVDARRPTLGKCYAKSLARDADTAGTMKVVVHLVENVEGEGQVETVAVESSEVRDKKLQTCVRNALATVRVAEAPETELDVEYTFEFEPETDD